MSRHLGTAFAVVAALSPALEASADARLMSPESNVMQQCEDDRLDPVEAVARVLWLLDSCFEAARTLAEEYDGQHLTDQQVRQWWAQMTMFDAFGRYRHRPLYPTFGDSALGNPLNYFAPPRTLLHPNASVPLPDGYLIVAFCMAS